MSNAETIVQDTEPPGCCGAQSPEWELAGNSECERSLNFRKRFFPAAGLSEWNDWRWQIRNSIRRFEQLESMFDLSEEERSGIILCRGTRQISVTPYYASLLQRKNAHQPLRRTVIPVPAEFMTLPGEAEDPLSEEKDSPIPSLVHRYPDRVLFLVTNICAAYCRYCTRSRLVGRNCRFPTGNNAWDQAIAYIESNRSVRDVLLSGGDPLLLPDEVLGGLLERLRRIPHVEIVRIGTKVPTVLPQRITPALVSVLKKNHPLWMNIHFTHPDELTPESASACRMLADAGIPLGSQTVLLSGINDHLETMKRLNLGLVKIRVRPYYLYQCDPITGSGHFRAPLEKGLEIMRGLQGFISGYAVPTLVIDAPGGGGKIPMLPDYVACRNGNHLLLTNYEGKTFSYYDMPVPGPRQADRQAALVNQEIA